MSRLASDARSSAIRTGYRVAGLNVKLRHAAVAALAAGIVSQLLSYVVLYLSLGVAKERAGPNVSVEQLLGTFAVIGPAMFASSATLLAVALLTPIARGVRLRDALALRSAPVVVHLAAAVGTLTLVPSADLLMTWTAQWVPDAWKLDSLQRLHELARSLPLAGVWLLLALMPGLGEELLFRGVLQQAARRGTTAILVSGIGFALFHVDLPHAAGVLPLGLFFAWVVERCGSVWVTVTAHVINNSVSIAATRIAALDIGYGTDKEMPWQWAPFGLVLAALCMLVIARATGHRALPRWARAAGAQRRELR